MNDVQGAALSFSTRELPALALALPRLNAMAYPSKYEKYLVRFLIEKWHGTLRRMLPYALRKLWS